jgi:hypothetical protein
MGIKGRAHKAFPVRKKFPTGKSCLTDPAEGSKKYQQKQRLAELMAATWLAWPLQKSVRATCPGFAEGGSPPEGMEKSDVI